MKNKKFMALYLAPAAEMEKMMADATPEQKKAGMEEWEAWMKQNRKSLADMGAPLGKTKRVASDGVSDIKNDVLGYSLVQAESHDLAAELFEGHPHFKVSGASIEVMECMPMPKM